MDFPGYDEKIYWLIGFVLLYWLYCILMGFRGAKSSLTAQDYFIAGRGLGLWVFVLAATATSFSGITFIGHPATVYTDGLPYGLTSFFAITIPFTGVLFLKRQWMLGKRYGFVSPGEMYRAYFGGQLLRLLVVLVALCFSVPYLGVQIQASGFLFNILTDGLVSVNFGMWALSAVLFIYVAMGGLRAVAGVDCLQCLLFIIGVILIGNMTLAAVGGISPFLTGVQELVLSDQTKIPVGYSHYVAIPGVIQFVSHGPQAVGSEWTSIMILTYMFALMGIQSSPAFSMWAFSTKNPAPFAPQQVWVSSLIIGGVLIIFTTIQGFGGHLIGLDRDLLA